MKLSIPQYLLFAILLIFNFNTLAQAQNLQKFSYAQLDSLVVFPFQKGDFKGCMPYIEAGREKALKEFGEMDSTFAEYTHNLAFLYNHLGQYDKAIPLLIQAKNIRKKILGEAHPQHTTTLTSLAMSYLELGQHEKALSLLLEVKNIREKTLSAEDPEFAMSLNNLAGIYQEMGQNEQALQYFIQAKDIMGKTIGTENADYSQALNNIAGVYEDLGKYDLALPLYLQAVNIEKKVLGTEHPQHAVLLNNLALLYVNMEKHDLALPIYLKAIKIKEKALGLEHPSLASSLGNLAQAYADLNKYDLALPLSIRAQKIYEKHLGLEHPTTALAINNVAGMYNDLGQYELALPLYIKAANIRKKLGAHHFYILALNNLASLYRKMGNTALSWQTVNEAIKIASGLDIRIPIDQSWADSLLHANFLSDAYVLRTIRSLQIMYNLLEKDQDKSQIIIISDLAIALIRKQLTKHSNDGDKLRVLSLSNDWLLFSLNILNKEQHFSKAFELADQNKSVLLLQATKAEKIYQLGDLPDSLVLEDKKLIEQRDLIEAGLLENRPATVKDSLRIVLTEVHQKIEKFKHLIENKYPEYAKYKYQEESIKTADIQKSLKENTALIEYVVADSILHIFYIDKKHSDWIQTKIIRKELKENIQNFHKILSNYQLLSEKPEESYQKYTNLAFWFYQTLIAPVLSKTPNLLGEKNNKNQVQNLIIIPDRELAHLPFESFLVEIAPQKAANYSTLHYLINDYKISYNYSAVLWKKNSESSNKKNNGQILAMAANYETKLNPALTNVRLFTDQLTRDGLAPLPAAQQEVEALEKVYSGFFAFDKDASEKNIKEKAGDYAVIHLAMHGLLDAQRPVLSSLVFTEDSDSMENNFWQAHEISKMKLNANLVVLSACETGYGKFEAGNGVASLARAFMYAGAPAMIVSLWQVNDFATSEIMKNLYKNLADGMEKDKALQEAKIKYLKEAQGIAAHPAFWSPFVLMGNTDVIYLKTKGGWFWWGMGICFLLLGASVLAFQKKQKKI